MFAAKEQIVRDVISAFDGRGSRRWTQKDTVGRYRISARWCVRRSAAPPVRPARVGCPFTCWSLTKLRDYLAEHKHIRLSRETIRQVFKDARTSWQNTKTWQHSRDPEFTAKKDRIRDLYDHLPSQGRVLCVDEFGPLNL
jgi:hypothetical protein